MLSSPSSSRRLAGRVAVTAAVAVAIPLTATRAIEYVDVPVLAASSAAAAPRAPAAPAALAAVAAQPAPPAPVGTQIPDLKIEDDMVTINDQTKRWEDLTPAEKAAIRRDLAAAREELKRVDTQEIQREVRQALAEARIDKEEMRREMAQARIDIEEAVRDVEANAAEIRRAGQDPEQIKASVRASLKAVEAINVEAITRQAMASVDQRQIGAALAAAEAGLRKAEADLDRLEARARRD